MEQTTADEPEEFARHGGLAGAAARARALTKVKRPEAKKVAKAVWKQDKK